MPAHLRLEEKLERFPPIAVRLLARIKQPSGKIRPLSDSEIASVSRLTLKEITNISMMTDWGSVPVAKMLAFMRGCGFDLDDRMCLKRQNEYMKKQSGLPRYLVKDPLWKSHWQPMMARWFQSKAS